MEASSSCLSLHTLVAHHPTIRAQHLQGSAYLYTLGGGHLMPWSACQAHGRLTGCSSLYLSNYPGMDACWCTYWCRCLLVHLLVWMPAGGLLAHLEVDNAPLHLPGIRQTMLAKDGHQRCTIGVPEGGEPEDKHARTWVQPYHGCLA